MTPKLTPRELEVLRLIADGFCSKEVGDQLGITVKTVEKHRQNLLEKFGPPQTSISMCVRALRQGIIA